MTALDLLKEIPEDWRDCLLLVNDNGEADPIRRISLITTDKGNRVVVIGARSEKYACSRADGD